MAQARRNRKNKTPAWVWLVIGILLGFFFSHVDFLQAYRFLEASIEKTQKSQPAAAARHAQKEETKFDFYNILSEKSSDQEAKLDLDTPKEPRPDKKLNELESAPQKKRPQNELSDLDAATHTRLPPVEKRSVTELPLLSKQGKQGEAPVQLAQPVQLQKPQKTQIESPKGKSAQEKSSLAELLPSKEKITKAEEKPKQSEKFTLQIAALRSYSEADRLKAQLLLLGFQGIQVQKIAKGHTIWFRVTVGNYSNRKDAESAKKKLQQNRVNGFIVPK